MLPRINRIKNKKDFEAIFKNSKSFKNSFFIFKIAKSNLGFNRFGFVVSQKVSKKAVVRNKVRRRLVEAVKSESKDANGGKDVVIIALPRIAEADFWEIKEAVKSMLTKTGLN